MGRRVIVVGGGFTGLTAARALSRGDPSLRITLIEAGPQLGGLAAGFPVCGTMLEKTYHYLLLPDVAMLDLVGDLGLGSALIYNKSSTGIYDGQKIYPFSTPLQLLRFSPCRLADRFRLGYTMFRLQRMRNWRPLVSQTAKEWLERACGPDSMREVWDPLLRGKFDQYWDQVSMAWLWGRVHTRANSRHLGREKIAYIRGGFSTVVRKLESELRTAGVEIRTGTRVERLEISDQTRALVAGGERIAFDRCLFTGPSHAFAHLLPADPALDAYRRQLESVAYLGAICMIVVTDQSLSEQAWLSVHDSEAPFLVMVNHTLAVGEDLYQGKQIYYLGCYRPHDSPWFGMAEHELTERWLTYLGRMFPGLDRRAISECHLFRCRNAQHVVDCDYERRIPPFRTPLPGVYLANFSQIFPEDRGTSLAVRDGLRVAQLILEDQAAESAARGRDRPGKETPR